MNDDQIRDLLRGMKDEPIPADSLARVRIAVGEGIQAKHRVFPVWKMATVLLAVGCLVLVAVFLRTSTPTAPLPVQAKQEVPRELPVQQPVIAVPQERKVSRPVLRAVKRTVRPKAEPVLPTAPSENSDVLIRIETPDPDVVILLVGE